MMKKCDLNMIKKTINEFLNSQELSHKNIFDDYKIDLNERAMNLQIFFIDLFEDIDKLAISVSFDWPEIPENFHSVNLTWWN